MVAADNNRLIVSWKLLCIIFTLMEMMEGKCSLSIRWITMYTSWPRNGLAIYLLSSFLRIAWSVQWHWNMCCMEYISFPCQSYNQWSISIHLLPGAGEWVHWDCRFTETSLLHLEKKKKYLAICVTIPLRKGNSLWYFGSTVQRIANLFCGFSR